MDLHSVGNHTYLIDPRSPISVNDYIVLFGKGDLKKVAKKVGLVHLGLSRNIIKAGIIDMLKSLHICEPIELPVKRTPKNSINSIGNMNMSTNQLPMNQIPNNKSNSLNQSPNMMMNNSFNNRSLNSVNGLPPGNNSNKKFIVHPSRFSQSSNERIKRLIKNYERNRNPRYIRNYSPNNDDFNLFKQILNNDSINNNKKFFKIKSRVKVPEPKKELASNRESQIEELTKTVKNISNQIGEPTAA